MIDPTRHLWPEEGDDLQAANIWRLMINKTQQGKGYGGAAIKLANAQPRVWGPPRIALSVVETAGNNAAPFYEKLGFAKNRQHRSRRNRIHPRRVATGASGCACMYRFRSS